MFWLYPDIDSNEDNFQKDNIESHEDNIDSDDYFEPEDDYIEPEDDYIEPEDDYIEPEDDYISDEDYYISDEELIDETKKITFRGMVAVWSLVSVFSNLIQKFHNSLKLVM
jgi:hypothetical protein